MNGFATSRASGEIVIQIVLCGIALYLAILLAVDHVSTLVRASRARRLRRERAFVLLVQRARSPLAYVQPLRAADAGVGHRYDAVSVGVSDLQIEDPDLWNQRLR